MGDEDGMGILRISVVVTCTKGLWEFDLGACKALCKGLSLFSNVYMYMPCSAGLCK